MTQNPYKYKGPLDPVKDMFVCVPREDQIKKVVRGIIWGEYWAILGPRQIGKSTFLRQLPYSYTDACYIYFNFEVCPKTEKEFYQWLSKTLIEGIPEKEIGRVFTGQVKSPVEFLDFLMGLKLKKDGKKIVLLFDEIELIQSMSDFLHVWRKLFHDRKYKKEFEKYSVVITGSVDLIKSMEGKTSPFNIASTHYIETLSDSESEKLIKDTFGKTKFNIDKKVVKKLLDEISGHPQLLQQTCHILLDNAMKQGKNVVEDDVSNAIKILLKQSDNLDTLREDLKLNAILEGLIREIFEGKKPRYLAYKEFSVAGAGCIVEDGNGFCAIRNKVYERFFKDIIDNSISTSDEKISKEISKVFICSSIKDKKWQEVLLKSFKMADHKIPFIWETQKSDQKEERHHELEEYINTADISLFLVSENSLTPDFLLDNEILALLKQKTRKGANVFPVLLPTEAWKNIPGIAEILNPSKA